MEGAQGVAIAEEGYNGRFPAVAATAAAAAAAAAATARRGRILVGVFIVFVFVLVGIESPPAVIEFGGGFVRVAGRAVGVVEDKLSTSDYGFSG